MSVKKLEVTFNPINKNNTFTCGDPVCGQVTLEVAKDCEIESLSIKFKGKAEVLWAQNVGHGVISYHSKDKYFSFKHYFTGGGKEEDDEQTLLPTQNRNTYSNVVAPGTHVYPFSFQIPFQDMPSSFKGFHGKIVYLLEATLSRSMTINKTDSKKINFVSNVDWNSVPGLMTPQHESKEKKSIRFSSGTVAMDVNIEKTGFVQGEGLKVVALIQNNSSRAIKPKYCVYRKHSFFASGQRKLETKDLFKEVGDPIPPSSKQNVTRVITIPHDLEPSILNCSILKVEYRLRVYLDVKYASDPKIKFPIVILPADQRSTAAEPPVAEPPAAAGFGFEPFGNPNPPVRDTVAPQPPTEPQPSDSPPPYGAYGMYPPMQDFGEGIKVVASIQNRSSRNIKPKYCLYKKYSYFASVRKLEKEDIVKEESEAIPPSASQTVTRILTIPPTTPASILNCNIIKVEYRLRVYLDVRHAEIKFPIVVLPSPGGPEDVQSLANPAYGFEAFPNSSMPGGTSFLQNPTASAPLTPPPTYGSWMNPSLSGFDRKFMSTGF